LLKNNKKDNNGDMMTGMQDLEQNAETSVDLIYKHISTRATQILHSKIYGFQKGLTILETDKGNRLDEEGFDIEE
jgi:hypothetical protein